jgi:hypothetical protein
MTQDKFVLEEINNYRVPFREIGQTIMIYTTSASILPELGFLPNEYEDAIGTRIKIVCPINKRNTENAIVTASPDIMEHNKHVNHIWHSILLPPELLKDMIGFAFDEITKDKIINALHRNWEE